MRIAVLGASGNLGTALLGRLRAGGEASVVGLVRRAPRHRPPPPYDVAAWRPCDVAAADGDRVVAELTDVFATADAVVHLAWAIQPSHDREAQRRTNVEGTRRVLEAAERAGVRHVVVASSVGAYAAAPDDAPRGEDWPTTGVPTSAYSVDKAAVERLLDEAEDRGQRIARLRPALVFQMAAGARLGRVFIGRLPVGRLLRVGLPVLPWPTGARMQAVHADDVAEAVVAVLVGGHTGAFNVAASDVLRGPEIATVTGGRVLPVPRAMARTALAAAWDLRLAGQGPGWLDLAASVPVLGTARARTELGWSPQWSGRDALADAVAGLAEGAGTASPPMRPADRGRPSLLGGQASLD